jgi:hypothetical protein
VIGRAHQHTPWPEGDITLVAQDDREMTRQAYERTVHVWAIPHVITVYQKSKTVWVAVGDYMGERIEVEASSANVTAKWVEAARFRDN